MKVMLSVIIVFAAASIAVGQSAAYKLSDLNWMSGCWASVGGNVKESLSSEQWMAAEGGMMLGIGRTIRKGAAVDYEFMRIEQRGSDLIFISRPKANKDDTEFKLIKLSTDEAVFENAAHDFPQRVIYKRNKAGDLSPRIEGTVNGKAKGIDFPMVRAACGQN